MLGELKLAILQSGMGQTKMAVALGWDPAKLSRIVNEVIPPNSVERAQIAAYLERSESELFPKTNASARRRRRLPRAQTAPLTERRLNAKLPSAP